MSNVTLLFTLHWQEQGIAREEACVGRLQPDIARPVFPSYDLAPQYRVMEALKQHSAIPVPPLLGLETDTSLLGVQFYIMGHIAGRIPADMPPYNMDGWMLQETSEDQRAALWRAAVTTMASFHQLDHHALGLPHLDTGELTPLQAQLAYGRITSAGPWRVRAMQLHRPRWTGCRRTSLMKNPWRCAGGIRG
ncbi:hypothetical protein CWI75_01975 [Kineobactrum sediminis]|uniref:Aminoglycoside phosphotransferase domain-containing protein n=2 Tax=Kineobactrum sediminis TaxID=1905677 RepID=A0A2N5Y7U6_9GAMM|nr:hypothetical protein CWI75_01975 [Kineobactrum sediminis]